jgi:hypothetical protein
MYSASSYLLARNVPLQHYLLDAVAAPMYVPGFATKKSKETSEVRKYH